MSQRHLYLTEPGLMAGDTRVLAVRPTPVGLAVAVADNLFRAASADEPADRGMVALPDGGEAPVSAVEKAEGRTWIVLDETLSRDIAPGTPVRTALDAGFRDRKRKLHTLVHAVLAEACRRIPGLVVDETTMTHDAGEAAIRAHAPGPIDEGTLAAVDQSVRALVLAARPVRFERVRSLDEAKARFGPLFRISGRHSLSGRLRVVVIEGHDANPCSGTHFETSDVGAYSMAPDLEATAKGMLSLRLRLTAAWTYWYGDRFG